MKRIEGVVGGQTYRYRLAQLWCDRRSRAEFYLATADGEPAQVNTVCLDMQHYQEEPIRGLLIVRSGASVQSFEVKLCEGDRTLRVSLDNARVPLKMIEKILVGLPF